MSKSLTQNVPKQRVGNRRYANLRDQVRHEGEGLFQEIEDHIRRFVVLPNEHAAVMLAGWVIHTHLYDCLHASPRLVITAHGKNAGKSIVGEVIRPLCPGQELREGKDGRYIREGGIFAGDHTPSYVMRIIHEANVEGRHVAIIIDEADIDGSTGGDMDAFRRTLNTGYRPSGAVGRIIAGEAVTRSTYAPVVIIGINGNIHDTTLSRAIRLWMRPARPGETYVPYRSRIHDKLGDELRHRIAKWTEKIRDGISDYEPELPGVYNRDQEVWGPLVTIADVVGGLPAKEMREAMYWWLNGGTKRDPRNIGEALLRKLLDIFEWHNVDRIFTADVLQEIRVEPEFKDIEENTLGKTLAAVGCPPEILRIDAVRARGYKRAVAEEAWSKLENG